MIKQEWDGVDGHVNSDAEHGAEDDKIRFRAEDHGETDEVTRGAGPPTSTHKIVLSLRNVATRNPLHQI